MPKKQPKDISEMDVEKLNKLYREVFTQTVEKFKKKYEEIYGIPFIPENLGSASFNICGEHREIGFDELCNEMQKHSDYSNLELMMRFPGLGGMPQTKKGWSSTIPDNLGIEELIQSTEKINQYTIPELMQLQDELLNNITNCNFEYSNELNKIGLLFVHERFEKNIGTQYKKFEDELYRKEKLIEESISEIKTGKDEKETIIKLIKNVDEMRKQIDKNKYEKLPVPRPDEICNEFKEKNPTHYGLIKLKHELSQLKDIESKINKEIKSRLYNVPKEILGKYINETFEEELNKTIKPYLMQFSAEIEVITTGMYMVRTNVPNNTNFFLRTLVSGKMPLDICDKKRPVYLGLN